MPPPPSPPPRADARGQGIALYGKGEGANGFRPWLENLPTYKQALYMKLRFHCLKKWSGKTKETASVLPLLFRKPKLFHALDLG